MRRWKKNSDDVGKPVTLRVIDTHTRGVSESGENDQNNNNKKKNGSNATRE